MNCDFCENCCSCHLNAPCNFCTSHLECAICGQMVCEDNAVELINTSDNDSILVCPNCAKEED